MPTVTEQKILNGLIEDEKTIKRTVVNAVAQIDGVKMALADMCAYTFANPQGLVDAEFVGRVTAAFQEQFAKLKAINDLFAMVEACGANDPVTGEPDAAARSAALNALITTHGFDPATFADRRGYK